MPSLRFANPELQASFLAGLKQLPFAAQIADDGSVVCTEEQWPLVNDVAHKVRDNCFKWYFSWCETKEGTQELKTTYSRTLRYESSVWRSGSFFPKSDKENISHWIIRPRHLFFCGASPNQRNRFFATGAVAICDDCIMRLHSELQGEATS
jgi:hypothetical protein